MAETVWCRTQMQKRVKAVRDRGWKRKMTGKMHGRKTQERSSGSAFLIIRAKLIRSKEAHASRQTRRSRTSKSATLKKAEASRSDRRCRPAWGTNSRTRSMPYWLSCRSLSSRVPTSPSRTLIASKAKVCRLKATQYSSMLKSVRVCNSEWPLSRSALRQVTSPIRTRCRTPR